MSKQTLVSQLLNMRKKQKWLEVETQETSATIAAIMLQLFKCSEFDVQADSLDVELVPVDGSSSIDLEKGTAIFQEDEHQEQLSRNESEKTLSGGDGVVEYDAVLLATSTDLHGEEDISEDVPKPAQFLYSMYTDPVVIAAEVSWLNTQESVIECSGRADELAKPDLSEAAAHTAHVADEHVAAVVPEVDCKTENSNGTEQFLYSLYTDAAVIGGEVLWLSRLEAAERCSGCPAELVGSDQQHEEQTNTKLDPIVKGASVSSGSSTKKRKVYRPPNKGVSRRLSQEEVNRISLQRRSKK